VRRRAEAKRLAERLRGELDRLETRAGVKANVRTDGDHSRLTFVFAKERVLEVLRALQPTSFVFGLNPDDLAEEIEPPQDEDATDYHVDADFHLGNDDEPGTMSIPRTIVASGRCCPRCSWRSPTQSAPSSPNAIPMRRWAGIRPRS